MSTTTRTFSRLELQAQYEQFCAALRPPRGGQVLDAKYEPGRDAIVLYALGSELRTVTVPAPGPLGDPGRLGHVFPADPRLPTLPAVTDAPFFARILGEALPGGGRLVQLRSQLLRYRPGRRATFAVRAGWAADGRVQPVRFVAKVYHDDAKAAAVAAEGRHLGDVGDPVLRLAPVLAHLADLRVVVSGHLPGAELRPDWSAIDRAPAVAAAGRALAALHRQTVPAARTRPGIGELDRFRSRATAFEPIAPDLTAAVLRLTDRVEAAYASVPLLAPVLSHGDAKPSQFLVQGDEVHGVEVSVLDLDHCGLADQVADLGSFVAALRQTELRARRPLGAGWSERLTTALLTGYRRGTDAHLDPEDLRHRVRVQTAVALVRKALRAFARAPRSPLPMVYLDRAARELDQPSPPVSGGLT